MLFFIYKGNCHVSGSKHSAFPHGSSLLYFIGEIMNEYKTWRQGKLISINKKCYEHQGKSYWHRIKNGQLRKDMVINLRTGQVFKYQFRTDNMYNYFPYRFVNEFVN